MAAKITFKVIFSPDFLSPGEYFSPTIIFAPTFFPDKVFISVTLYILEERWAEVYSIQRHVDS